jgi:hypothetical protein
LAALAIISASVLGLELALMRTLAISRYHHFAYLVVGLALLGFGASGTWLGLFTARLLPHFSTWIRGLTLTLALSISLCCRIAEALPLDIKYILFSGQQLLYLFCYQVLIFSPFLVAGFLIGLTLLRFSSSVNRVYGANLLGSGVGPIVALGLMSWLSPARIIQVAAVMVWATVFLWNPESKGGKLRPRRTVCFIVGLLLAADTLLLPVPIRFDPHKMLPALQRWEAQGDAQRVITRYGPRARLDVYSSPRLHQTLFAGLTATTPPPLQSLLLADGDSAGPIFHIDDHSEAAILEHTPMSVAYRLLPTARVLLLGESSGVNVWLARRFDASQITVVVENPQILDLFRGHLKSTAGQTFSGEDLDIHVASPRHYLEYSQEKFDLIQVVSAEGMAAGVSTLLSLHENYLLTVEGMSRCLEHLTPRGIITITRGLQSPPRDNIKVLATLTKALENTGIQKPGDHLGQLRNHLAVCTLATKKPLRPQQVRKLVGISDRLWLDIDTLPGFDPAGRRVFNRLMDQIGVQGSLYQLAAGRILSTERERFFDDWAYNVRPATDDRPYFFDFFRWRSLPRFIKSHGRYWFQRLELGYVVLVLTFVLIVAAAFFLLLLPLFFWARHGRNTSGWGKALGFFLLIGLAYLALEMSLMQRFTLFLGDPLLSAAGVLSSFLFFSGCGSLCSRYRGQPPVRAIIVACLGIAIVAPMVLLLSQWLLGLVAHWNTVARLLLAATILAPLAFLMGWPFPAGLTLLERRSPDLMPWAWGINGFASVAAAPLTVILAMSLGFRMVLGLAVAAYLAALVLTVPRGWGRV